MTTGRAQCTFELFIINDGTYRDYDLGDKLNGDILENGYDCFESDVCELGLYEEIAEDLYKVTEGQMRYKIHIYIEYTVDWEGEHDMDYYYVIDAKDRTDHFDHMEPADISHVPEEEYSGQQ